MRYFFRRAIPPLTRVLLVESGSRSLASRFVPHFLSRFGHEVEQLDVVTCFPGVPEGFPGSGNVYRTQPYASWSQRLSFLRQLRRRGYTVAAILCSGEPVLLKWKLVLAAALPVKVLIVNENCDYFWLDWGSWRIIRQFLAYRLGLSGIGLASTLGRLLVFPFVLLYLVLYTACVHLRRRMRAWV